ncbi:hypothetical protein AK812_SmicGene45145, partial [Symbiodinium microadriaticum]
MQTELPRHSEAHAPALLGQARVGPSSSKEPVECSVASRKPAGNTPQQGCAQEEEKFEEWPKGEADEHTDDKRRKMDVPFKVHGTRGQHRIQERSGRRFHIHEVGRFLVSYFPLWVSWELALIVSNFRPQIGTLAQATIHKVAGGRGLMKVAAAHGRGKRRWLPWEDVFAFTAAPALAMFLPANLVGGGDGGAIGFSTGSPGPVATSIGAGSCEPLALSPNSSETLAFLLLLSVVLGGVDGAGGAAAPGGVVGVGVFGGGVSLVPGRRLRSVKKIHLKPRADAMRSNPPLGRRDLSIAAGLERLSWVVALAACDFMYEQWIVVDMDFSFAGKVNFPLEKNWRSAADARESEEQWKANLQAQRVEQG